MAPLCSWASASPPAHPLVVHEWGTFTSVEGSNGVALQGLQHEDEPLPDFVYGRDSLPAAATSALSAAGGPGEHCCSGGEHKRVEQALLARNDTVITQKLETPVIYFYSDQAQTVKVDVDFPGGVISQWFPNASHFSPPVGGNQPLANGSTQNFRIDVA